MDLARAGGREAKAEAVDGSGQAAVMSGLAGAAAPVPPTAGCGCGEGEGGRGWGGEWSDVGAYESGEHGVTYTDWSLPISKLTQF